MKKIFFVPVMMRFIAVCIVAVMVTGSLASCGKAGDRGISKSGNIQIVATIFPEYDWVMNILGDNPAGAEVTLLLDNGVDLHSYQPTTDDILKISTCDLLIYVGGESDGWIEDVLKNPANSDMVAINLLETLGDSVKEEEEVEGMQEEDEHEHGEEEPEYDEHVWLSLKNAMLMTEKLTEAIETMDPVNSKVYEANATAYKDKLAELDHKYADAVSNGRTKTLLFGDRFPFRYLVDDYGLNYYAAFAGCSAETEASFETITFLSQKVDELSLNAVMTIEGKDHSIAETIVENTKNGDQRILTLDSIQSVTSEDAAAGVTYLSIMESNLEVLKEAIK